MSVASDSAIDPVRGCRFQPGSFDKSARRPAAGLHGPFGTETKEPDMSGVRVLVGTRKGAFILTSDGARKEWEVSGPLFAGWEIYHLSGSPVDPNRLYASQSSGWFGQTIQRSDDGGTTWEPVGNQFAYQ